MRERPLWIPAIVLTPVAIAAIWAASARLETATPWPLIIVFATIAVGVADWPHWVAEKVVWSNTVSVALAAAVLSPATAAPLVATVVMMATAFYAPERKSFKPSRFLTNAGLLAADGFAIGVCVDLFGPTPIEPSPRLLAAVATALIASATIALISLPSITAYRFGRTVVVDHLKVAAKLPLLEAPMAAAVALMTSLAVFLGSGWVPIALACSVALVSFPVKRARLAAYRTNLITTVTNALDRRGLAAEPHQRMEALGLRAGRYLRFTENQLQQLRYVCLTYAMTDLFANELARPLDEPRDARRLASRASRVLFYGLALDDVADEKVNSLGEAVARLDALMFPEDDDGPLRLVEALDALDQEGFESRLISALHVAALDRGRKLGPPAAMPFGFSPRGSVQGGESSG